MKQKYVIHTVENLMEYVKDILIGAEKEEDFLQMIKALEVAEDLLYNEFKFEPEIDKNCTLMDIVTKNELEKRINSLKEEIGKRMLFECQSKIENILDIDLDEVSLW